MEKTVLIAGAGIAGLTMAYWLSRYGYKVTVVELAPGLRKGGAAIDVRGDAIKVAERMGILGKIRDKKIITAVEFVDADGQLLATLKNFGEDAKGVDIELYRDHLLEIVYEADAGAEYLFGYRIAAIDQDTDKATVTFDDGDSRNFDLVIGADGVHSTVRKLIFGPEHLFNQYFGAYFAILKAGETQEQINYGQIYNMPGKMAAASRQGNSMLLFRSARLAYNYRNSAEAKKILMDSFAGCGWKIPGILTAMADADNLYFDELCQIHMPCWTKRRVALTGDAAYCAGFPTGMGTSLAMQGAAMLADELMLANGDYTVAFSKYNNQFHPLVATIQATMQAGIDFLVPETEEAIKMRNEMIG